MKREILNDLDLELIIAAKNLIKQRQIENKHAISSVLRTKSGKIFKGIHLEAYVGRIAVCAEAVAIGEAAVNGDTAIDTIVAVYNDGEIVSPCGMCRELISDYSSDAKVILKDNTGEFKVSIKELIPMKYSHE